jgi:proteasome accessory factor A
VNSSLFGLEAELAISARKGRTRVPVEKVVEALVDVARRELPHLCGGAKRMFLGNGGLLYVDAGSHPEIATPECTTPWQAVAHLRSAEQVVASLACLVRKARRLDEVFVNRCNVDYLDGTTWGCHESYLTRLPIEHYENWLVPHLASRVYTGSGGLDPLSAGIRFSLSPRVAYIDRVKSPDSTSDRGIFHTRDESLSRAYHRLHILVGDNACSQLAQLLKIGSTALVIALAESPQEEPLLKLRNPVEAMKGFARDLGFRTEVQLQGRRRMKRAMTALEIQYHYLERIEASANSAQLPEWAARLCRLWRTALEDISRDAGRGLQGLDWTLKRHLMNREIERSGFCRESVDAWSDVLENLQGQLPDTRTRSGSNQLMQILALHATRPEPPGFIKAGEALAARGLDWTGLGAFAALRQRLCEIDVRFGLVQDGIFDTLDRRGLLPGHRVVSEAEIGAAARDAPANTRAHVRGQWVKRLASGHGRYQCSWEGIRGEEGYLNLGDPFATESEWSTTAEPDCDADELRDEGLGAGASHYAQREEAYELYRSGRYSEAEALLTHLLEEGFEPASTCCHLARVCLMTDQNARAREHVAQALAACESAETYVVARTIWLQLALEFLESVNAPGLDCGIASSASPLLGKMKTALRRADAVHAWWMAPVLEHLEPHLAGRHHALLGALVAAMNDRNQTAALDAHEGWQAQAPYPLEGT